MLTYLVALSAYLDTCVFALNTSRHESSKFTPFELMHILGCRNTPPVNTEICKASPEEIVCEGLDASEPVDFTRLQEE